MLSCLHDILSIDVAKKNSVLVTQRSETVKTHGSHVYEKDSK